jgi:RHS repeat-associated protein
MCRRLGSSRLSTFYLNRNLAYDAAYTPYGETYVAAGAQSDLNFTGMRPDTQTGLYDFPAREYSTVGRWISPDPASLKAVDITNPQSWNRYAYVNNYPLTYTDPQGLCPPGTGCPASNPCAGPIPGQGGCNTSGNFPCLICGADSWDILGASTLPNGEGDFVDVYFFVGGNGSATGGWTLPANNITCATVLPDGSTVGSHVNSVANSVNNSAQLTADSNAANPVLESQTGLNPFSVMSQVYSGTNFRAMYGGPGANYQLLGDAGNFAYFAVSANIGVPLTAAEVAAGAYSITHHPPPDWVGPFGMDPSATRVVSAGYGAKCGG